MTIEYNVIGPDRKRLVEMISEILEQDVYYMGAPSFSYQVGEFTIDKTGALIFEEGNEEAEMLVERLMENDFYPKNQVQESTGFQVSLPKGDLTDEGIDNLMKLLAAKSTLIKKALGVEQLTVITDEEKIGFPWFSSVPEAEEIKAYTHFISALCELAKKQKRVTAKEKEIENEKYAFRCFLLRLGFIGEDYKEERKILLKNLSGCSGFKSGQPKNSENLAEDPECDEITDEEEPLIKTSIVAVIQNPERCALR